MDRNGTQKIRKLADFALMQRLLDNFRRQVKWDALLALEQPGFASFGYRASLGQMTQGPVTQTCAVHPTSLVV